VRDGIRSGARSRGRGEDVVGKLEDEELKYDVWESCVILSNTPSSAFGPLGDTKARASVGDLKTVG